MGLLDHLELQLVWGIPPLPQDSQSNESVKELINLLTPQTSGGIVLADLNGWSPNVPGLKNDGLWSESAIAPGRRLIAGERANPIEIMNIVVSGSTEQDYNLQLSRLNRLIERCREFWTSGYQIDPVYLKWHACGAPGLQYALISNINLAMNDADDNPTSPFTVTGTLELEREVAWRWEVTPGGNPKRWAYYKREELELWNSSTASLIDTGEHLKDDTVQNRREWNATSTDVMSRNYFDIPAASVPGDAPALCFIGITPPSGDNAALMIARTSKPTTLKRRTGATFHVPYILNGGDALANGSDTTIAADTGAPISNAAGAGRRLAISFATVTSHALRATWYDEETLMDANLLRGKWAFFARARLSAVSNVTLQIRLNFSPEERTGIYFPGLTTILVDLPQVTLTTQDGSGGTGNTTSWNLIYLGQSDIPASQQIYSGADGRGVIASDSANPNFAIELHAGRPGGATNLYISDLILMPVDEPTLYVSNRKDYSALLNPASNYTHLIDSTGYLGRGQHPLIASLVQSSLTPPRESNVSTWQGQTITLLPSVDNRLHFLGFTDDGTEKLSSIADAYTVWLNIVPRSYGIRDA